jgi:hypothetical protein
MQALTLHDLIAAERIDGVCVVPSPSRSGAETRALVAVGLSGFLSDDYVATILTTPPPDITTDILERSRRGDPDCPLLSVDSIAHANAGAGLNLIPLCWVQRPLPGDGGGGDELAVLRMKMFLGHHRGYNFKRVLKQGPRAEEASLLRAGFLTLNTRDDGPGLYGLTRAQALAGEYSSAIGLLFTARPPQLGLNRKQQQVLLAALDDLCDDEIAHQLGVSSHAINMRWRTIYEAVSDRPKLEAAIFDASNEERAAQKRRRLLAYVRAHIEELRPYCA